MIPVSLGSAKCATQVNVNISGELRATSGHYDRDIEYDDDNSDNGNDDDNEESNNDNKDNSNDDDEEEGEAGAIGQERPIGAHGARRQQGRSARSVQ
eukprot:gene14789-biopygen9186